MFSSSEIRDWGHLGLGDVAGKLAVVPLLAKETGVRWTTIRIIVIPSCRRPQLQKPKVVEKSRHSRAIDNWIGPLHPFALTFLRSMSLIQRPQATT